LIKFAKNSKSTMQRFRNRLMFYGIGFIIGLILMFFMFGTRGCAWFPENRVKNMIAEKEILIGDSLLEIMNCAQVTNVDIYSLLNENGDVDFSLSKTHEYPKKYWFSGEKDGKELSIIYALGDSLVEVLDFNFETKVNCSSTLSNVHKTTVPLPDDEVRAILESNKMRIMSKAECQMKCMKFAEGDVLNFHKTAKIEIGLSRPREPLNPIYVLRGTISGTEVLITYVIGENRTRIADISPNSCNCEE
jgi:hypothetical protein